ncbi:MAG: hypothetical protein IPK33_24135 [Gemmatimonadetes bacterium]|nr:hypothetical protein [Gemmatimonadota bacterium]
MVATLERTAKQAARQQHDPATYARMAEMAMLREAFIKAQEYRQNHAANPALPRDTGRRWKR